MKKIDFEGYNIHAGLIASGMYNLNKNVIKLEGEDFKKTFIEQIKELRIEFGVEEEEGK